MVIVIELEDKVRTSIAMVLVLAYGITMAQAGVSIPGCAEGTP